ncbi:hypothetical protein I4U23_022083 [Adineta vaga]|nr:hypothetical protein I4U23_022083 [Adineta vaga]
MLTKFEQLPNELILRCFSYLDFLQVYELFYNLNQRFHQLIRHESKLYINLDAVSETKRLTFYLNLNEFITTSQNYPISVTTHDEYNLRIIFYDDLFKDKLYNIKSMILSNIKVETIYSIIFETTEQLYENLRQLKLLNGISTKHKDGKIQKLCNNLISSQMKSLIYLYLNFEPYQCGCHNCRNSFLGDIHLDFEELSKRGESLSQLETLIIGELCDDDDYIMSTPTLGYYSLIIDLLPCLPKLKNLFINSIHFLPIDDNNKFNGTIEFKKDYNLD